MNFWRQLVSGKDNVSSKRFAGLCLIGSYMIHMIIIAITGSCPESFEGLMKTTLYTGGVLLGAGLADGLFKNVQRTPVSIPIIENKEDDTESK